LSATVVDIVGAAPMVGEGWFDRRAVVALAAAERLTSGWFTDIRVATRAPGRCAAPAVVGVAGRGERFAGGGGDLPVGAGVAILVELTALGLGLPPDRL